MVTREGVDTAAVPHVPHLDRVVERACDDLLALRVKVEAHDLGRVAEQRVKALAHFDVPQPCRVVHRTGRDDCAVRIERQTDDLGGVAAVRVIQVAVICVPQLAGFVCGGQRARRPRDAREGQAAHTIEDGNERTL